MQNKKTLSLRLEIIWWVFTLLLTTAILFPIVHNTDHYPFLIQNAAAIIVFVTMARHIFLLKHSFLAYRQKLKIVLFFLCIPIFLYFLDELSAFNTFVTEVGLKSLFEEYFIDDQNSLANFIRTEFLFFGVGSMICSILFAFRLMISIWRVKNRGTV